MMKNSFQSMINDSIQSLSFSYLNQKIFLSLSKSNDDHFFLNFNLFLQQVIYFYLEAIKFSLCNSFLDLLFKFIQLMLFLSHFDKVFLQTQVLFAYYITLFTKSLIFL